MMRWPHATQEEVMSFRSRSPVLLSLIAVVFLAAATPAEAQRKFPFE